MKKIKSIVFLLLALSLIIATAGCSNPSSNTSQNVQESDKQTENTGNKDSVKVENIELKIRSGSTSGSWYPATGVIAQFLPEDIPGITCTITPGAGQSNAQAIQDGTANFAFGKVAATFQGFNGETPFTEKTDKIRNLGYLYDEAWHLVVNANSEINSIADLKGKRLTTQTTGNLAEQMTRDVLEAYSLSYNDLKKVSFVGYEDSIQQMKDGIVDAFAFATATPASALVDLGSARDVKIIPIEPDKIDTIISATEGYLKRTIEAGTYDNQSEDILTIGSAIHMMVSSDMSEDMAYKITKSIYENIDRIGESHATYLGLTPEKMAIDLGFEYHPGALKYFNEIGVTVK